MSVPIHQVLCRCGASIMLAMLAACSTRLPEQAVVAEAGEAKLSVGTLQAWLGRSPSRPTLHHASAFVSNWMDQALLATAVDSNIALDDSATASLAILPDATGGVLQTFWSTPRAGEAEVSDAAADSVYRVDQVRVFQLWAIRVPPDADRPTIDRIDRAAQEVVRKAKAGADFTALVRASSQDPRARSTDGFIAAKSRGDLSPDAAAFLWVLPPGGTSPIVQGGIGLEVFHRPTASSARPALKAWLARQADSVFADSLVRASNLRLADGAPHLLRVIALEPVVAPPGPPLATWDGGSLTRERVRMWVMMAPPEERSALRLAADATLTAYLDRLARQHLLADHIAPDGVLTPEARAVLIPQYRAMLQLALDELRRRGSAGGPAALAEAAVSEGWAVKGLPGALASVLRSRFPVRVDVAALDAVVHAAAATWDAAHPAQ